MRALRHTDRPPSALTAARVARPALALWIFGILAPIALAEAPASRSGGKPATLPADAAQKYGLMIQRQAVPAPLAGAKGTDALAKALEAMDEVGIEASAAFARDYRRALEPLHLQLPPAPATQPASRAATESEQVLMTVICKQIVSTVQSLDPERKPVPPPVDRAVLSELLCTVTQRGPTAMARVDAAWTLRRFGCPPSRWRSAMDGMLDAVSSARDGRLDADTLLANHYLLMDFEWFSAYLYRSLGALEKPDEQYLTAMADSLAGRAARLEQAGGPPEKQRYVQYWRGLADALRARAPQIVQEVRDKRDVEKLVRTFYKALRDGDEKTMAALQTKRAAAAYKTWAERWTAYTGISGARPVEVLSVGAPTGVGHKDFDVQLRLRVTTTDGEVRDAKTSTGVTKTDEGWRIGWE